MKTQTLSSYANFCCEKHVKEVFMQKSRIHVSHVNFIIFECIVIGSNRSNTFTVKTRDEEAADQTFFVLKETTLFSWLQGGPRCR